MNTQSDSVDSKNVKELKLSPENTTVLRLLPDNGARELISNGHYIKSDEISMTFKGCVDLAEALALKGAYRMVVPPGVSGKVMQFVSNPALTNTYSCDVLGTGGKFADKVGYATLSPLGITFMIYSALAFITGLYFFKTITKMLEQIKGSVEAILNLLLDIQDSHFDASWQYLEHVSKSSREIVSCDRLRNATLVNVQRLAIENRAYFNLNMRNIDRQYNVIQEIKKSNKWEHDKVREIWQKRALLDSFCQKAALSLMLHTYFAAVELELSGMTDPRVLDAQYSQIKHLSKKAAEQFDEIALFWGTFYDNKEVPNIKEVDRQEIRRSQNASSALGNDARAVEKNFKALVERLEEFNSKPVEFIWLDGNVYIPKTWAKGQQLA